MKSIRLWQVLSIILAILSLALVVVMLYLPLVKEAQLVLFIIILVAMFLIEIHIMNRIRNKEVCKYLIGEIKDYLKSNGVKKYNVECFVCEKKDYMIYRIFLRSNIDDAIYEGCCNVAQECGVKLTKVCNKKVEPIIQMENR